MACPPRSRVNSATSGAGIVCECRTMHSRAPSWTLHGPASWVQHGVLCWPHGGGGLNWNHCSLNQSTSALHSNLWELQSAHWGPWFQRQGSKTRGFRQTNWGQIWVSLSIHSRRLKNSNGNYYLTGELVPSNQKPPVIICGPIVSHPTKTKKTGKKLLLLTLLQLYQTHKNKPQYH